MVKNESGRTLTETLAMLAIVGVLSVIGIAGFSKMVDKNKANTLIQEAQRRAVIVAGQIGFNGNTPSLAEFEPYKNTSAGTFDSKVYYNEGGLVKQFGIKVDDVEKNVCQNVLNTIGDTTPIRRLSKDGTLTTPITTCDVSKSAYIIIYNEDMTANDKVEPPTTCKNDSECKTECATCKIEEDEEEGVCVGECDSACEVGDTCGDNECVVCDSETKTCQNQCEEIEYLEGTGTQYIDTGILNNTNVKMKFKVKPSSKSGSYFMGVDSGLVFGTNNGVNFRANGVSSPNAFDTNTFYTIEMYYNGNTSQRFCVIDGSETLSNAVGIMLNKNILLFAAYENNTTPKYYLPWSISECKMWNNTTLVRDFIPVHTQFETNGKYNCMFDKVSKKLFCNAGSGDFTAGPKK